MTTNNAPDTISVELKPVKFTRRDTNMTISAQQIVDLDSDLMADFIEQLSERIKDKADTFSPALTVVDVLTSPELERETKGDTKGKPKTNPQTGQMIAKSFDIKTQRTINRILTEVETKLDKMGDDREKHKPMTIKLKPKDALYLAKRMMVHFDEFGSVQTYVPDAYDIFADLKAEATKSIEKDD